MAKRDREDNTGVFYQTICEARIAQQIANKVLRATVNQTGTKRVIIATKDYERAENLRRMLVENEVSDSISIATSATAVYDYVTAGPVALIVAEEALSHYCADLLGDPGRVYEIDGHDEETVAEIAKSRNAKTPASIGP